jgi:putative Holliday junction resolvase
MTKTLALDLGDVWVGTAISDVLGITCRPFETVKLPELHPFLKKTISEQGIGTIVVGHPKTMSGTSSNQTKRIEAMCAELEDAFPAITWVWADERLSSRHAINHQQTVKKQKRSKQSKNEVHSLAAAFILQGYLDSRAYL